MEKENEALRYHRMGPVFGNHDNLSPVLLTFAEGLAKNPQLLYKSNKEMYEMTTLLKYLRAVIWDLRKRFPRSATWTDQEFQITLKKRFKEIAGRRNQVSSVTNDDEIGEKTVPCFRDNNEKFKLVLRQGDFEPCCMDDNLLSINSNLMNSTEQDCFMYMLALAICFSAEARGGEVKFIRYDRMYWDPMFLCLVSKWFQMKTVSLVYTSFMEDSAHFEISVFFLLAAFWACENGLKRDPAKLDGDPSNNFEIMHVFQHLFKMKDASVAKVLSRKIKKYVSTMMKDYLSVKSLRVGAATILGNMGCIEVLHALLRGGWKTKTSMDHYCWQLICAVMPGMRVLAGYTVADVVIPPPCLEPIISSGLCERNVLMNFVDLLFPNDLPQFKINGKLRALYEVCAASIIMHYPAVVRKYGSSHKLVIKMLQCGFQAQIAGNNQRSNEMIDEVLRKWSHAISSKWQNDKLDATTESGSTSLTEKVKGMTTSVMQMQKEYRRAQEQNNEMKKEMKSIKEELTRLKDGMAEYCQSISTTINAQFNTIANMLGNRVVNPNVALGNHSNNIESVTQSAHSSALETEEVDNDPEDDKSAETDDNDTNDEDEGAEVDSSNDENDASNDESDGDNDNNERQNVQETNETTTQKIRHLSTKQQGVDQRFFEGGKKNIGFASKATQSAKGEKVSDLLMTLFVNGDLNLLRKGLPVESLCHREGIDGRNRGKYQAALKWGFGFLSPEQYEDATSGDVEPNVMLSSFLEVDEWVKKLCAAIEGKIKTRHRAFWSGFGNIAINLEELYKEVKPTWNVDANDKRETQQEYVSRKIQQAKNEQAIINAERQRNNIEKMRNRPSLSGYKRKSPP